MEQLSSEVFVVAYAGLLLASTAQLRWIAGGKFAYVPLASLVIAVKAGDIGGYTIGRLFGRRKMSPRLSPGKTWAGFFGAIGGAAIGSAGWLIGAANYYSDSWFCVYLAIAFGMTMGLVGLLGDLCESLIKRDVGQKDAAALFPGFGGLLDLLDSVVYAGPIAWLWWSLFPPLK
jgi:phosphatidate cytidylyltransferase